MNISKQLERLLQRVNQLSITKSPPTLRMVMIKDDDMPVDLSEWAEYLDWGTTPVFTDEEAGPICAKIYG